jgi:hypothetical protein
LPDPCRSIITIRIGNIDNSILVGNDQENLGLDGEIRELQQLNQLTEVLIFPFKFDMFGHFALKVHVLDLINSS